MTEQNQTPEEIEEAAMNQRLQELDAPAGNIVEDGGVGNEKVPSPLEERVSEVVPEKEEERRLFLGDWTEEDVIARLRGLDELEEKLSSKLMGKLGPLGRDLKALKEAAAREWEFDPAVLEPLKTLDEGIYDALKDGLTKGLKLSGSVRPVVEDVLKEHNVGLAAAIHDSVEERLVQLLVPNYLDLSEEEGFAPWLMENQSKEVVQAFRDWDDEGSIGKKDSASLVSAYKAYLSFKEGKEKSAKAKDEALKRSAVKPTSPVGAPVRTSSMSEEEAFQARLREIEKQGFRL